MSLVRCLFTSAIVFSVTSSAVNAWCQEADTPAAPPAELPNPRWIDPPRITVRDAPASMLRGVSGEATVGCQLRPDGRLTRCVVVHESPPGQGFGAAAVRVAQRGRVQQPSPADGGAPPSITTRLTFNVSP